MGPPRCRLLAFWCNEQDAIFCKSSLHCKRLAMHWRMSAGEHAGLSTPNLLPQGIFILQGNTKPVTADRRCKCMLPNWSVFMDHRAWNLEGVSRDFVSFGPRQKDLLAKQDADAKLSCHLLVSGDCHRYITLRDASLDIMKGGLLKCRWCLHEDLTCTICYIVTCTLENSSAIHDTRMFFCVIYREFFHVVLFIHDLMGMLLCRHSVNKYLTRKYPMFSVPPY